MRQCLFTDLILRYIQRKSPDKLLFVWADNLGTHKTNECNDRYASSVDNKYSYIRDPFSSTEESITAGTRRTVKNLLPDLRVGYLPENTTAFLQPCDLVLNSLLKAFGRQLRNILLYNDFQEWTNEMDQLVKNGQYDSRLNYYFEASKVNYKQRLFEVIQFYDDQLLSKLKDGVVTECFIKSGLAPVVRDVTATAEYWNENYTDPFGGAAYKKINLSNSNHQKSVEMRIVPAKVEQQVEQQVEQDYDDLSVNQLQDALVAQDDKDFVNEEIDVTEELSDIGDNFEVDDTDDNSDDEDIMYSDDEEYPDDPEMY